MPYGNQSPLLGSTIDPRLFIQDFSGYEKAASTRAMGVLSATNQVSAQVEDYTKQQKEAKDRLKAGATLIDAASKMFPSQAPMLEGVMQQLKDEDIPLSERSAIAAQIGELINMGVGEGRYQQEYGLKQQEMAQRAQGMDLDRMNTMSAINSRTLASNLTVDEIERGKQIAAANAPAYLELLTNLNKEQGLLSDSAVANYANIKDPVAQTTAIEKALGLFGNGGDGEAPVTKVVDNSDGSQTTWQWQKGQGWIPFQAPGGAAIGTPFAPKGAKATVFGFSADPYKDTNSLNGVGAFTSQFGKMKDNDFALSPDMEKTFREQGISPGDTVAVQMENGDTVTGRWMDRTAQDGQISAGKIPGVDKPLRGRIDFYTPGGVNPYDGMGINAVAKVVPVQAGQKPAPSETPTITEQIALKKFDVEQKDATNTKIEVGAVKTRVLNTINKYLNPDGTPNKKLQDATGFGEGVGSWIGKIPFVPGGNTPEAIANQKELNLSLIESGILEASKALKPVSNDEMKMLRANRPAITDPPEVWAKYMLSMKEILGNPDNFLPDGQQQQQQVDPVDAASGKLQGLLTPR